MFSSPQLGFSTASSSKTLDALKKKAEEVEVDIEEDIIDEEIDDFLNSSEPSNSEEATKDETVSEKKSLAADYKEDF